MRSGEPRPAAALAYRADQATEEERGHRAALASGSMVQVTSGEPAGPGELLRRDHARLDALFTELLDQFEEGNQHDVRAAWVEFDDGLTAHLDLEERVILPLFAQVDRAEAEALRAEHVRIRQLLAELGVGVDLHLVRLDLAREFIDALRAHARREDQLLYRWAESELPVHSSC